MIVKHQFDDACDFLEELSSSSSLSPILSKEISNNLEMIRNYVSQLEREAEDLSKELEIVEGGGRRPRRKFDDEE